MTYSLSFISEEIFDNHVKETLLTYNKTLKSINLNRFNSNLVDPIKLLFDKSVYGKSFDDIISFEIQRQRDKTNTNAIGYFHQNMFKYISGCEVPEKGWDVVFSHDQYKIYVEMKNKHNTMNSSSSQKTYIRMLNLITKQPDDYCFLVEVIAPISRNIPWICSIDAEHIENNNIRRVSIDKFYEVVTGKADAFYQMCMQLPKTINKLISNSSAGFAVLEDTVINELQEKNKDTLLALYILAFERYEGFSNLIHKQS